MPTATVLVQGKSEPERGKKRGRIKSDSGMVFQADPALLKQVNVGSTYEVEYKDDTWERGDGEVVKFRVIERISNAGVAPLVEGPRKGGQNEVRDGFVRPSPPAQQYMPTTKDEDIATLAIAKEQLGKITPGDIEAGFHVLKASTMMWRKFKEWQKLGPRNAQEEMDDEIPFN